eukprot:TRINITY_DN2379_c0_g1_i1.p1 TRINITY_DN2379_c0_g1~~TRINITY_DN2379_c0_g1_i1.p1  ORF type:complete len:367 (+),score=58.33 TRINITY_DN2379_c0_g1_i1:73-1173(+)
MDQLKQVLSYFFQTKKVYCQEKSSSLTEQETPKSSPQKIEDQQPQQPDDYQDPEEQEFQKRIKHKNLPPQFEMFMNSTLAIPKKVDHIKGFRFEFNQPFSQQFGLTHAWFIPMAPKQHDPTNPMQDSQKDNTPNYQLQAQFVGGSIQDLMQGQDPAIVMSGKYQSDGKLEGQVIKKLNDNVLVRLAGQFEKGSDLQQAQMSLNVEYQGDYNSQAFKLGRGYLSYSLMQAIGKPFFFGFEFMYLLQRHISFFNYSACYKYKGHDFKGVYIKHADIFQLTYQMHLHKRSYVFSSLGLKMADSKTNSIVGLKQKFSECEVQSQINSRGKICTLFNYFGQFYSCKFCVIADYLKNNYKFGLGMTLGQQSN